MVRGLYRLDGPDMKTKVADLIKQEKVPFFSKQCEFIFMFRYRFLMYQLWIYVIDGTRLH